jgi:hypothetical protein
MPRRLTQHNLNQVLRHVDLQQPEASPLVTVPAGPHGGLQTPVFATGDKQFDRVLRRWVQQAVPQQPSPAATPLAEHPRSSLQQASYFQPVPLANRAPAAGPSLERGISQGGQEARGDRAEMGPPTQDPFSAEVFNQQFGRRAPPGESR